MKMVATKLKNNMAKDADAKAEATKKAAGRQIRCASGRAWSRDAAEWNNFRNNRNIYMGI